MIFVEYNARYYKQVMARRADKRSAMHHKNPMKFNWHLQLLAQPGSLAALTCSPSIYRIASRNGCFRILANSAQPFEKRGNCTYFMSMLGGIAWSSHSIWILPEHDNDYSSRWQAIKKAFSKLIPGTEQRSATQIKRNECGIWQRRFWEHTITDDHSYAAHMDTIHYNPMKHGGKSG